MSPTSPPSRCPVCKRLHPGTGRCPDCERRRDRARGTRQQRGYDGEYDRVGRSYQRRMDAGERFFCWRCDPRRERPLGTRRGVDWTLGHCDDNRGVIHGPECPGCQYATSGRRGPCPHRAHRRRT